jgi:hypothetical protein
MTREELQREVLDYLSENLTIRTTVVSGQFGGPEYVRTTIELDGEEITSDTFDLPKEAP